MKVNEEKVSKKQSIVLTDDEKPTPSFADTLYEKITSVIGGNNPNNFFCMGLPGTLVEPNQYSYDIENNEPKPAHVKANESKLVNKLFDACTMSAADNGRHLQTQYKTALDVLTPKLNGKLFDAKTQLREALMTTYPYNFGDGVDDTMTLSQVFYRLFNDYVEAKCKWSQKQLDKRNELQKKHPGNTQKEFNKRNDEYLDWYATVAESENLVVEEKLGVVLDVFSKGDMEIITAILDSGAGREVAEARTTLDNVGELNPDGGIIYPVTLYPENWFTLLDTSFMPTDLLESPAALAQQLSILVAQRSNLTANINAFLSLIPDEENVKQLKLAYDQAAESYKSALDTVSAGYVDVTVDMLKSLADVMTANNNDSCTQVDTNVVSKIFGFGDIAKAAEFLDAIKDKMTDCMKNQNDLVSKAQKAADSALEYFTKKNLLQYKTMLEPLRQQQSDNNAEIKALQEKINLATHMQTGNADISGESDVAPKHVPEQFTQVIITSSMKEANQQSSSSSKSSSSSYGVSFFFGGCTHSSSHQEAVSQAFSESSEMSIQIGMSIAKVQIGREWFNPGLFMLTSDMYNTSSTPISPQKSYDGFTDERLRAMNECLFPCFPTAFVVARDVTVKFSTANAMSSSFAESVEDHSSTGGGFFIFSGSSSNSSGSSSSSSVAKSDANSVTVRFTNPQILGYYLEATPPDHSVSISADHSGSNKDFISIFEFIDVFKKMLDAYNEKFNIKKALK